MGSGSTAIAAKENERNFLVVRLMKIITDLQTEELRIRYFKIVHSEHLIELQKSYFLWIILKVFSFFSR